jgi:diguanylate cyclase (GGDEF)-like protein/PAS domain S-box-containing protein
MESETVEQLPVPERRSTMLDLVAPMDRMAVITAWEKAQATGLAYATVRLLSDVERQVTMGFFDVRHRYGVWVGVIVDEADGDSAHTALVTGLAVSRRPRTATVTKNMFAVITDIDERTTSMLGFTPDQMIGARSLEFIHPDDHERAIGNWVEMLSNQESQRVRLRHRRHDGDWLWVELENTYHANADARESGDGSEDVGEGAGGVFVVTQITDISDEMAAHEAVQQREQLFRTLAESLPAGLFQVAADRSIVYANARLANVLGVQDAAGLDEQLSTVDEVDRPRVDAAFEAAFAGDADAELEVAVRLRGDETRRRCLFTVASLPSSAGAPGAIVTVSDVTEGSLMREQLRLRATYDALTGCHNRASTIAMVEHALTSGGSTAVVFVDLDNFKPVNDELGHAAGDAVLVEAARRLTSMLREDDVVGRIGGDEFLLVCHGVTDDGEALAIAQRVRDTLHGDVELPQGRVWLRSSIGVAVSGPGGDADALVARADAAMYESKRARVGDPVLSAP